MPQSSYPQHPVVLQMLSSLDGKSSNVLLSFGIAVQHHVPTHDVLAGLLESVGNDPHAAIVNAAFAGTFHLRSWNKYHALAE